MTAFDIYGIRLNMTERDFDQSEVNPLEVQKLQADLRKLVLTYYYRCETGLQDYIPRQSEEFITRCKDLVDPFRYLIDIEIREIELKIEELRLANDGRRLPELPDDEIADFAHKLAGQKLDYRLTDYDWESTRKWIDLEKCLFEGYVLANHEMRRQGRKVNSLVAVVAVAIGLVLSQLPGKDPSYKVAKAKPVRSSAPTAINVKQPRWVYIAMTPPTSDQINKGKSSRTPIPQALGLKPKTIAPKPEPETVYASIPVSAPAVRKTSARPRRQAVTNGDIHTGPDKTVLEWNCPDGVPEQWCREQGDACKIRIEYIQGESRSQAKRLAELGFQLNNATGGCSRDAYVNTPYRPRDATTIRTDVKLPETIFLREPR